MSENKFDIEVYPALKGDCFLIQCKNDEGQTNILIDAGYASTSRVLEKRLKKPDFKNQHIDLMVITHFDADHIAGTIRFLNENNKSSTKIIDINEIWHNSYSHLFEVPRKKLTSKQKEILSFVSEKVYDQKSYNDDQEGPINAKQGSTLGSLILSGGYKWNKTSNENALAIENIKNPISVRNVNLTLLSPNKDKLDSLKSLWYSELKERKVIKTKRHEDYFDDAFEYVLMLNKEQLENEGLISKEPLKTIQEYLSEEFEIKDTIANGSSIAFVVEFNNKKALFLGDAQPDLIVKELKKVFTERPILFDLVKVSHHGSKNNINDDLAELITSPKYLFSTNGKGHNHPDGYTISKILHFDKDRDKILYFNYKTDISEHFKRKRSWKKNYKYKVEYIESEQNPINLLSNG